MRGQGDTPNHSVYHEAIMGGFGGQGVLKMGQTLAEAAMAEGRQVVWTPAYGPEMRGGPAFCTVIISSDPIGSPVVSLAHSAMIMDPMSLPKYTNSVRPSGIILVNTSLVQPASPRPDIRYYGVRANHLADEIGDPRVANMVMLGAFLHLTQLARAASIIDALRAALPERHHHLLPMNDRALTTGAAQCAALTPAMAG